MIIIPARFKVWTETVNGLEWLNWVSPLNISRILWWTRNEITPFLDSITGSSWIITSTCESIEPCLVNLVKVGNSHTNGVPACPNKDYYTKSILAWRNKKVIFIRIGGVLVGHIKFTGAHSFLSYVNVVNHWRIILLKGGYYDLDIRKEVEKKQYDFWWKIVLNFDSAQANWLGHVDPLMIPDFNTLLKDFLDSHGLKAGC
jgi:hypothetical protein